MFFEKKMFFFWFVFVLVEVKRGQFTSGLYLSIIDDVMGFFFTQKIGSSYLQSAGKAVSVPLQGVQTLSPRLLGEMS